MRIATFNIKHGGGSRIDRIGHFVIGLNVDALLLTEYRENTGGKKLRSRLLEAGFKWQFASSRDPKTNCVLLASTIPFSVDESIPYTDEHAHRLLFARFAEFNLIGAYFPQKGAKQTVFERIATDLIPTLGPFGMVLGDLNTGLPFLDEKGKTFHCVGGFQSLMDAGLIDSWRSRNRDTQEYSWFSNAGNGFRIDHALCTPTLDSQIVSVRYLHDGRGPGVSDHSVLLVEIAG